MNDHPIIYWSIRLSILAIVIYFIMNRGKKTREELEIVEDMQASVFHPQEGKVSITPIDSNSTNLSLWQHIKSQPVAVKRFLIIASMIYIIIMTVKYDVVYWITYRLNGREFNEYFILTYLPLIILFGIYWIISGIKKD